MPAPAPMQFSPLQFASQPNYAPQTQQLGQSLANLRGQQPQQPAAPAAPPLSGPAGAGLPGNQYAGPVAPTVGAPVANPAAPAGAPAAQPQQPGPSVTDIIRNMTPPQIASWLQNTSTPNIARAILPQGMQGSQPGSAALFGAGMLPAGSMGSTFGG